MAFKVVVSDPKTRKSYQKEVSGEGVTGKKIGEKVSGSVTGLEGYELEITGGTDKDGFPMRKSVEGTARKKILIAEPPGFHPKKKGQRRRKSVRGNTISEDLVQINTKIVKYGSKKIEQVFGKKEEKKKEEKEAEGKGEKEKPAEKAEEKPKEEKAEEAQKPAQEKGEEKAEEEKPSEKAEEPKDEAKEEAKEETPGGGEEEKKEPSEKPAEAEKPEGEEKK